MNENPLLPANSNVIKGENLRLDSIFFGRILKHQVLNAEEQARNILLEANRAAAELVATAEIEADAIRQNAFENGRDEAVQELLEDVLAAKEQRVSALREIEQNVLRLAVRLAEKIIGLELKSDENARVEIVLTALRQARQQEMLTVRVNAADLPLIEKARERFNSFGRAQFIDFIADQMVGAGGCLIESQSGTIDARLETQIRVLEKALLAQIVSES